MHNRIWNERGVGIGGRGAAKVIAYLRRHGYDAVACSADTCMPGHEGIAVPVSQINPAARLVELTFGRGCPA